jgi:cell division protein FtsB
MSAMIEDQDPPVVTPAADEPRPRRTLRGREVGTTRRRRLVTYGLFIGSAVLMVNALVGENGYLATVRARREYGALMASVARLRLENQDLRERVRQLKEDPAAIEEVARRELGLIRPGETLVIIHNAGPAAPASVPR